MIYRDDYNKVFITEKTKYFQNLNFKLVIIDQLIKFLNQLNIFITYT